MLPSGPELLIMVLFGIVPILICLGIFIFLITLMVQLVRAVETIAAQMEKK